MKTTKPKIKVNIKGKSDDQSNSTVWAYVSFFSVVIIIICAISIFAALSQGAPVTTPKQDDSQQEEKPEEEQNSSEAAELQAYNAATAKFNQVNSRAVYNMLSSQQTGFIYIGRPTCPYSRAFGPRLASVIAETKTEINYYNTDAADSDTEARAIVFNALGINAVPTFIYIKGGVIVDRLADTTSASSIKSFIQKYQ